MARDFPPGVYGCGKRDEKGMERNVHVDAYNLAKQRDSNSFRRKEGRKNKCVIVIALLKKPSSDRSRSKEFETMRTLRKKPMDLLFPGMYPRHEE